jgi:hypothetical protein
MPHRGQQKGGALVQEMYGRKRIRPLCSWIKRKRSIFSYFNTRRIFLDFSMMQYDRFLNSVLTKVLKMKPSFLGFFISKIFKFLKISNRISWFSVSRQNWTGFHENQLVFIVFLIHGRDRKESNRFFNRWQLRLNSLELYD